MFKTSRKDSETKFDAVLLNTGDIFFPTDKVERKNLYDQPLVTVISFGCSYLLTIKQI